MTTNEQGRALGSWRDLEPYLGKDVPDAEVVLLDDVKALFAAERAPGVMTDERIDELGWQHLDGFKIMGEIGFARAIEQEARAPLLADLVSTRQRLAQFMALCDSHVTAAQLREARISELERQLAAKERETLGRAVAACEKIEDEYREREGTKWPEMKQDAETGARDCAEAIRALANGGEG